MHRIRFKSRDDNQEIETIYNDIRSRMEARSTHTYEV